MNNTQNIHESFLSLSNFIVRKYVFKKRHTNDRRIGINNSYLAYIIKGEAYFTSNEINLSFKNGDIVYIPQNLIYKSEWYGTDEIEFYSIVFRFDIKSIYSIKINNTVPKYYYNYKLQKINDTEDNSCKALFDSIYEHYNKNDTESLIAIGNFYILYNYIINKLSSYNTPQRLNPIKNAANYIENNYTKKFNIAYLAKICNLSESRFHRVFKKFTGCTPINYKNKIRISHAIVLLADNDYTVESLSEILNFNSPSYFLRVFKDVTGKNLTQYRQNLRHI